MNILRKIIKPPTNNSVNKLQAYIYPEECKQMFIAAAAMMTDIQTKRQRQILNKFVRNIF